MAQNTWIVIYFIIIIMSWVWYGHSTLYPSAGQIKYGV